MIFGELAEDLVYWGYQLQTYQEVIYWAMWCLVPSFCVSLVQVLRNKSSIDEVWFISSLLNLIIVFITSLYTANLILLVSQGIGLQILLFFIISHLTNYEK